LPGARLFRTGPFRLESLTYAAICELLRSDAVSRLITTAAHPTIITFEALTMKFASVVLIGCLTFGMIAVSQVAAAADQSAAPAAAAKANATTSKPPAAVAAAKQAAQPETKSETPPREPSETRHSPAAVRELARGRRAHEEQTSSPSGASAATAENVDETPVVTHHKITVAGQTLQYTATVAQMPIKNSKDETEAHIFFMAYTLDGADPAKRPVTFAFNGGPGSASIWVHMGAMGPRSPKLLPNGDMPRPPFELIDNEFTWLGTTDLVFIDPVGTGYSRAKTPEIAHRMNGVSGDLESVGEFIRMYITRNERWGSPLFIAGESYGTFRAAGLAGRLLDDGIAVNGIVLISTVLNMGILEDGTFDYGGVFHLPTMTADAWYHKKLPADLQKKDLKSVLKESEHWATNDYLEILNRGTDLSPKERKAAIAKLARYTGLEPRYIDECDLHISGFLRELLRREKLVMGSYDGRLTAPAPLGRSQGPYFDPSGTLVRPPFTAAFQQYIRGELGYKTDMEYSVLRGLRWDWESQNSYAETAGGLQSAFYKNPHMRVMICSGYYDSVTPYFSVRYTFSHMGLHPEMLEHINWQYYEAGHMMYIDHDQHRKMTQDFADFVKQSLQ
jgi:carboxypeptidase C (cathepsin A)